MAGAASFGLAAAEYKPDAAAAPDEVEIKRSFFCVGDTKQAIYGWRGGVAEIFDAVVDQLPDVVELKQNKSFRSSPLIMDVVNQVFQHLPNHPLADAAESSDTSDKAMHEARALVEFSRRFPNHESAKPKLPGYVCLRTSRIAKDADSQTRRMICLEDAAQQVAELYQRGPDVSIGVLTRTNLGVAQMIFLLERLGIEVSQEGGNPLTDSAAVEMVLSALMMSEHPGDGRWAFHLSASPLSRVAEFGPDLVRADVERSRTRRNHRVLGHQARPGLRFPRDVATETAMPFGSRIRIANGTARSRLCANGP